jgi:hypothetical protein
MTPDEGKGLTTMERLSRLTLIFAVVYSVFVFAPALLSQQFGPYPLMKTGDVVDVLTPLVLLPLYWLLYRLNREPPPSLRETIFFLVLAAVWSEGQGMHLSANSINHLVKLTPNTDAIALAHFYDEVLSHYLWHLGVVGLSALLIVRQWQRPFLGERSSLALETIAALIYGFTFFVSITEGGTAPLGLPFAVMVSLIGLIAGRSRFRQQPVLAFFVFAHVLAMVLFGAWFLINGGSLPKFSELGLI